MDVLEESFRKDGFSVFFEVSRNELEKLSAFEFYVQERIAFCSHAQLN